jgi:DNA-binding response OmpR family regulator
LLGNSQNAARVTLMQQQFKILIADRNRHVREFLRREFCNQGYCVQVVKDGPELLASIDVTDPPDLLILDPEIPLADELEILCRLQLRNPPMPVVIHAFLSEYYSLPGFENAAALVEKKPDTGSLLGTVANVLRNLYPERFAAHGDRHPSQP